MASSKPEMYPQFVQAKDSLYVKPRVLLDCDGVLCDLMTPTLRVINEYDREPRGLPLYTLADLTHWEVYSALNVSASTRALCRDMWNSPGFARGLLPYAGAVEAVRELKTFADVYVVTSANHESPTWMYDRVQWLQEHFRIGPHRVVFTDAKHLVEGDMFVDDKRDNVAEYNHGAAFLWTQPYNADAQDMQGSMLMLGSFKALVTTARRIADSLQEIAR